MLDNKRKLPEPEKPPAAAGAGNGAILFSFFVCPPKPPSCPPGLFLPCILVKYQRMAALPKPSVLFT